MAFTAQIVFTGICGIVPKKNPPDPPQAFCVLLPNNWKSKPDPIDLKVSTVDDVSRIRRHTPFVHFTTQLPDPEPKNHRHDLEGLWFLNGHRLVVNPTFDGNPSDAAWGNLGGLASFADLASPQFHPHLSVANAVLKPTASLVAAQVVLHHGTLSSTPLNAFWVFESYLRRDANPPMTYRLNHQVTLSLDNLLSLEVIQTNFAGTRIKSVTLSQGPALVTVANLCDENPLQWGEAPAPDAMPDDDDFRLHYEVVDSPADLAKDLGDQRCPIPRLTRSLTGGNGLNCLPLLHSQVNFPF